MSDTSTDRAAPQRRALPTTAALLLTAVVALVATWLLASWCVDHVVTTRLWRVETVVAPLVVGVGTLATAWVGASSLVAGACAAARATGGAWRTGEIAVQRWAPGLVRRALAVAVATGVGLGTAVGAHATVVAPPTVVAADLGWTPTSSSTAPVDGATMAPAPSPDVVASAVNLPETSPAELDEPASAPHLATATDVLLPADSDPAPTTEGHDGPGTSPADAAAPPVVPVAADPPPPVEPTSATPAPPRGDVAPGGSVVVRTGDTLWGVAARALGPDASDAEIAAEWPRWYAANERTIGPDPDILLPGQVLVAPGPVTGGGR